MALSAFGTAGDDCQLETIVSPGGLTWTIERTDCLISAIIGPGGRTTTLNMTLWIVLAMGVLTDLPIRQVFKHASRMRMGERSPHRSSLCVARQRLGVAPVRTLFRSTARPLARPETIGGFYKGFLLAGIDGVIYNTPDTPASEKAYPRPSGDDRPV